VNRPDINHTSRTLDEPGNCDPQAPWLRVYTLGPFNLAWQVAPFTTEDLWKSRTSARTLFKLLLCAPHRQASRSQLAGILWPETDEDRARESLRSASKVLRKVLRTADGEDLLETCNNNTVFKLAEQSHLWVDVDAFEEIVAQASRATAPEEALALWQEANNLLRGEFLAGDQGSEWTRHRWIKTRQQALRLARGRMVRHLADLYLQHGQYSLAEEVLEQHLMRFPTDQDALYRLLALLEQQGSFDEARLLYERARRTLETLGKQPAAHVRTQYERLQETITSRSGIPALQYGSESRGQVHLPGSFTVSPGLSLRAPEDQESALIHPHGNVPFLLENTGASDGTWDVLRIVLETEQEGKSGLPLFSRRQGLELGIVALISQLAQLDGTRVSVIEREAVNRALSESILDGWKHLFLLENAQIVAIGRAQLALIHQAHTLVSASALPYFYAGAHSFLGIGLHFQERDEEALEAYHYGYIASLATGDPWYVAQSLICQADSYHALGHYGLAIQAIEEALRVIAQTTDDDEKMTRARAHLLSCWADNAMMLHDDRTTQAKLDLAETYLDPGKSDEEFDRPAWLLIAGKYAFTSHNDATAKACFEEALRALPEHWLLRHVMTATGLAMACARLGERDASLTLAKELIPLLHSTNAPLTNRWFSNYLQQDLLGRFPTDDEIQGFVAAASQQFLPHTYLLRSGMGVPAFQGSVNG
jgi:DNA-binding SARP family transcriptional activator